MKRVLAWGPDLRDMARFAAPIVLVNVGIQAMGVVDTLMVGKLGGAAIAAVALGNLYFFNVSIFGIGLLLAIDPVISQAIGAGDHEDVARGVQRGLIIALVLSVVVTLALLPGEWLLDTLRQPADVTGDTALYTRRRAIGVVPFFIFSVLRQTLQAMGKVWQVVETPTSIHAVTMKVRSWPGAFTRNCRWCVSALTNCSKLGGRRSW